MGIDSTPRILQGALYPPYGNMDFYQLFKDLI